MIGTRVSSLAAVAAAALLAVPAAGAADTPSPRLLTVVSLNDFTIGGHRFLGRTPLQVTSAFGKPTARTATATTLALRYGQWTISFKQRKSDRKLLGFMARASGDQLYGVRGGRLLGPGFGRARIAQAVTAEVGWVEDGNFNDWIPRQNSYVGADFPRTISWGIDAHGRGWLQIKTDLDFEFPSPAR